MLVGYFYAHDGTIGPAGWNEPAHGRAVIDCALREASQQAREVKLMTAGANHAAIRAALESGLRLAGSSHLLCSKSFGALDQYLPSGPALF